MIILEVVIFWKGTYSSILLNYLGDTLRVRLLDPSGSFVALPEPFRFEMSLKDVASAIGQLTSAMQPITVPAGPTGTYTVTLEIFPWNNKSRIWQGGQCGLSVKHYRP